MDIKKVLSEMTIDEKLKLLSGKGAWFFNGVERLGLREIRVSDGPHGVRVPSEKYASGTGPNAKLNETTLFPCEGAMSATWDPDLIYKVGKAIGNECNHFGIDVLLGPGANGKRNPLGGRNFEYYSEDPILSGKMATAFVNGVQSTHVGTSLKHFILNEQETNRRKCSSNISRKTLRELYALPFEMCIKEAKPLTIMASYNQINGIYACHSKDIMQKLLREDLGYEGLIISDWGAVQNKADSINAGLNIEMPETVFASQTKEVFEAEKISVEQVDRLVEEILRAYDWVYQNPNQYKPADFDANHELAYEVAKESIVLLKNKDNILPLDKNSKILLVGDFFKKPRNSGGGSSTLRARNVENPYDEFMKFGNYDYAIGFKDMEVSLELEKEALDKAKEADYVIVNGGTTEVLETEGFDRPYMNLPQNQVHFIKELAKLDKKIIFINNSGAPVEINEINKEVDAVIHASFLGVACGKALAEIVFGVINPNGKLSETWPLEYKNVLTSRWFPERKNATDYEKEGIFTGYRYFDSYKIPVLYPFGFGLSYTNFEYNNLKLSKTTLNNGDELVVSFDVKNTGKVKGKEVAQVYVKDNESFYIIPEKLLKNFIKVELEPNEVKNVTITLTEKDFSMFYEKHNKFVVEKGDFTIMVGPNVNDIKLSEEVFFDSKDESREPLNYDDTCLQWQYQEPEIFKKICEKFEIERHFELEQPLSRVLKTIYRNLGRNEEEYVELINEIKKSL